jgi:hypothetical protein
LLDQQRDVVVVFWAKCVLPIQSWTPKIVLFHIYPSISALCPSNISALCPSISKGDVARPIGKAIATKRQNNSSPKYDDDISFMIYQYIIFAIHSPDDRKWEEKTGGPSVGCLPSSISITTTLGINESYCAVRSMVYDDKSAERQNSFDLK